MPAYEEGSGEARQGGQPVETIDRQTELSNWLSDEANEGNTVRTRLRSSERVIARVTDGIYRDPASALREVISNAWDADANEVSILTDAPRFSRIFIRDDGMGMSHETLSNLLHSIGGSAKRRESGQRMGVASPDDPDRSPGGRLLIGKIGIGLFSVSQLSRRFRIITKMAETNYRLIAEVHLRTFAEDFMDGAADSDEDYVSGEVLIKREASTDTHAHGTDIVLDDVKPRVRDLLRSADRWRSLQEKDNALDRGEFDDALNIRTIAPRFHAGWMESLPKDPSEPGVLTIPANLPWEPTADPGERMSCLVNAVESEFSKNKRPELGSTLDAYLHMLWTLGLSAPVSYVDRHPFELTSKDQVRLFWLSNEQRGQAVELDLAEGLTVREAVKAQAPGSPELQDGLASHSGAFRVEVDGVELKHPIRYEFHRTQKRGLETSMLFVGQYAPDLSKIHEDLSGGSLALEAYLFWNGRIVPKENNGVLVRVRGASGQNFDSTFMDYQISEQTRLRQITSEIFIQRGLDAALNIDRESFNYSHPHVQLVVLWLHRAIRQLTNRHKDLTKVGRVERRAAEASATNDATSNHARRVWENERGHEEPPDVEFADNAEEAQVAREQGVTAFIRGSLPSGGTGSDQFRSADVETKAAALVRVLEAHGLLDDRSYEHQQRIVDDIIRIFVDD